jgi:hypothetical protein
MISQKKVKDLFFYSKELGRLFWKKSPCNAVRAGAEAGTLCKASGYRFIFIAGKRYSSHRIMWLFLKGKFPKGQIDHIDGNKINNKISNLRDVTATENQKNQARYKNNSSGFAGVSWLPLANKWQTYISHNRKRKSLGNFEHLSDAVRCRLSAEISFGYHSNHGRDPL